MTASPAAYQYKPLCKPTQLICGSGQTAVITGWTVKEAIARRLQTHEYAVIGQLYSPTRGISFLIRNLLANPHVRFLVVVNATKEDRNAGGCECLLDFFRHGFSPGESDTGRHCWVIRSSIAGYIDLEIEPSALEQLRQSVAWQAAKSIPEAIAHVQSFALQAKQPWGLGRQPLIFPQPVESAATVLPGPHYGHRIEGRTIAETWVKIIQRIRTTGVIRPTLYDGQWQELINVMAIVQDEPPDFYFPEPNYLPCDRPFIQQYISQILEDAPEQEGIKYTYGQRLRSWFGQDQIEQVIEKLIAEIDSARAVMSLWDVRDHAANHSPPCLNHIWVRVVGSELSLTATFRSNDMFSAWPANAIGLRALQQHIRDEIVKRSDIRAQGDAPLRMGPLITVSQSAHVYDDCWDNADKLIQSQYPQCQQRDYSDPSGNFVISVQAGRILVERMTPGSGEVVDCYSGSSASQVYRQIAAACPALQVDHALYLGTELQKAELSVTTKALYVQDQPLRLPQRLSS